MSDKQDLGQLYNALNLVVVSSYDIADRQSFIEYIDYVKRLYDVIDNYLSKQSRYSQNKRLWNAASKSIYEHLQNISNLGVELSDEYKILIETFISFVRNVYNQVDNPMIFTLDMSDKPLGTKEYPLRIVKLAIVRDKIERIFTPSELEIINSNLE